MLSGDTIIMRGNCRGREADGVRGREVKMKQGRGASEVEEAGKKVNHTTTGAVQREMWGQR